MQALVRVIEGPRVTRSVLLHLQSRRCNAAGISGLARREVHVRAQEVVDSIRGTRHICSFSDVADAVRCHDLSRVDVEFVLSCARQGDVGSNLPDVATCVVLHSLAYFCSIGGNALAADFLNVFNQLDVHAIRGGDVTSGVRHRYDGAAELLNLLCGVDGHITGTGDDDPCPSKDSPWAFIISEVK